MAAAEWPAVLDVETHAALRRVLLDPTRQTNGGKFNRRLLLSGGLLRCWRCGSQLYSRPRPLVVRGQLQLREDGSKQTQDTYVCIAPVPDDVSGCRNGKLRIVADELDEYVARSVMTRYLESPALAAALAEHTSAADEQKSLLAEAEMIKAALEELEDDYRVHRLMERDSYLARHATLAAQRRDVDEKINSTSGQTFLKGVTRDPDELKHSYETGTHDWRRAFISSLVDHIVVGPGKRGLNRFDPSRVTIQYRA